VAEPARRAGVHCQAGFEFRFDVVGSLRFHLRFPFGSSLSKTPPGGR
jgi:hypothetical protein